ncbi:hypothetical protein GRJ2_001404300 [Grus japonensis]|uniref:Uncharacterized protein n=1 Tax=Grus japonensis TaxID=30415 RepID=A0ABC9WWE0_GRUJA
MRPTQMVQAEVIVGHINVRANFLFSIRWWFFDQGYLEEETAFPNAKDLPSFSSLRATFIFSSSTFQERGKDFGRLYRARTQNALNTASVAEEQEEMRRVFADGCDCQNSQIPVDQFATVEWEQN